MPTIQLSRIALGTKGFRHDVDWNSAHHATDSDDLADDTGMVGWNWDIQKLYRIALRFDSTPIQPSWTVLSAQLNLYPVGALGGSWLTKFVRGAAAPSNPCVVGDFDITKYTLGTVYGSVDAQNLALNQFNAITLDPSAIVVGGQTRLLALADFDITDGPEPGLKKYVTFEISGASGHAPTITVTYSAPSGGGRPAMIRRALKEKGVLF